MKNENEIISDFATFTAINCPADGFPPIEEAEIRVCEKDKNRLELVFENTPELQKKLSAFRRGKLRIEPSEFYYFCKQKKQELWYLKEGLGQTRDKNTD